MTDVSLDQQIEEVQRELALRRSEFPSRSRPKMRLSVAEFHMKRMEAVLVTLERLERKAR